MNTLVIGVDRPPRESRNGRQQRRTARAHGFLGWLNKRLPVDEFVRDQLTGYYAPKNFNFWYFFGVLSLVALVMQLVTGIFLTMHYKVGETTAFDSVEYIMREVPYGWLLRYMHSTGASFFFIVVYLHMFRALLYGSYKAPRELLWLFGMVIYLALMAEAFMGYVLPWGNMSFWGAQVIVNLFGTIPVIGPGLVDWIRGDYGIADATLNRFFSLHVVAVPLVMLLLVAAAPGGAAPDRVQQSGRHRDQGKAGRRRQAAGRHSVPSLLHGQGHRRRRRVPDRCSPSSCSSCRPSVACSSRTPNFEPANPTVDAGSHRAGVVLHAVLRNPARGARPAHGRAADGAVARGLPVPAMARPLAGQVDPLSRHRLEAVAALRSSSRSWCSCGSASSRPKAST